MGLRGVFMIKMKLHGTYNIYYAILLAPYGQQRA